MLYFAKLFEGQEGEEGQDSSVQIGLIFGKGIGKFAGSNAARYAPEAVGAFYGGPVGQAVGRGAGVGLQALFNHFFS